MSIMLNSGKTIGVPNQCGSCSTKMNYIYLINAKTILQTPNQPDYAIVFVDKSKTMKMITVSKFIM